MSSEVERKPSSGWLALFILTVITLACIGAIVLAICHSEGLPPHASKGRAAVQIVLASIAFLISLVLWNGLFTLTPNQGAVLLLFGAYKGTARQSGFHYLNPLYKRIKVSLRSRTLNGEKLKVNDQRGNPIDIAAVVVWHVKDTSKAVFEVDNYESYVSMQSETAVRHLASAYPYDSTDEKLQSLRGAMDEVSQALREELQVRLSKAGVTIEEARLSHLAYAPEIAGAMLRRQQAEAVVAARFRIVEGAVSMVQLALEHLEKEKIVELDAERKAAMVSNLLVVLCGEQGAQPVLNTGTLYT